MIAEMFSKTAASTSTSSSNQALLEEGNSWEIHFLSKDDLEKTKTGAR